MSVFDAVAAANAEKIKISRREFFNSVRADFKKANTEIRISRRFWKGGAAVTAIGSLLSATVTYVALSYLFPDVLPMIPIVTDLISDKTQNERLANLTNSVGVISSGLITVCLAKMSNNSLKRIPELLDSSYILSPAYKKAELKTEIRCAHDLARQKRFLNRSGYFDTTNINPWQRIRSLDIRFLKLPPVRVIESPRI